MIYQVTERPTLVAEADSNELLDKLIEFKYKNGFAQMFVQAESRLLNTVSPKEGVYYLCSDRPVRREDVFCDYLLYGSDPGPLHYYAEIGCREDIPDICPDNVLWKIRFDYSRWDVFDDTLAFLKEKYLGRTLYLMNHVLNMKLVRQHPCNAYLCSGCDCHAHHSNYPRVIDVDASGDMYPFENHDSAYFMGNIEDPAALEKYNGSQEHRRFLAANREAFFQMADKCAYPLIPWRDVVGGRCRGNR